MPARSPLDSPRVNWAMLRFRPIAPKPSQSAGSEPPASSTPKNRKRTKRKYVRVRDRRRTLKPNGKGRQLAGRSSPPENSGVDDGSSSSPEKGAATLQLMPETEKSEENLISKRSSPIDDGIVKQYDHAVVNNIWDEGGSGSLRTGVGVGSVVMTWIMVECVTAGESGSGSVGLGFTDWEKVNNLRRERCPGFVSNGAHKVVWVNEAYRRMLGEGGEGGGGVEEVRVWLAVKEGVELDKCGASFACRCRVRMTTSENISNRHGRVWHRVVTCDVWRMDYMGCFAWKLDSTTALGLGLGRL